MRGKAFTEAEKAIIIEEIARGYGWALRAHERLPHRTADSLRTYASGHGLTRAAGFKPGRTGPQGPRPANVYIEREPAAAAPAPRRSRDADRAPARPGEFVPDFLREQFAKMESVRGLRVMTSRATFVCEGRSGNVYMTARHTAGAVFVCGGTHGGTTFTDALPRSGPAHVRRDRSGARPRVQAGRRPRAGDRP